MKFTQFLIIGLMSTLSGNSQSLTNFITKLASLEPEKRQAVVDSFKNQRINYPIIESDTSVFFISFAKTAKVKMAGDFTNWRSSIMMDNIPGTDLWYHHEYFPKNARIEYKIEVNEKLDLDILNPQQAVGGFGANSDLIMPAYQSSAFLNYHPDKAQGTLADTVVFSKQCKENRAIKIYLPPGYHQGGQSYPVVIYHDGADYLNFTGILTILDNLSASPCHLPLIAVFVVPVQRDPEYSGKRQKVYTSFIIQELMPFLEKNYRIKGGAENHVISGISNGGNIALWIAGNHPDVFGKAIVHSSNIENNIFKAFSRKKAASLSLYLDIGRYDLPLLMNRYERFLPLLKNNHIKYYNLVLPSGHNWNAWNNKMGDALLELFDKN